MQVQLHYNILYAILLQLYSKLQLAPVRQQPWRRGWLVVVPVRVPPDGHGLPECDPAVVGETLLHVHLVPDVQVRDVAGVHWRPLERRHLPAHSDLGLAIIGKCGQKLNHSLRKFQVIPRKWSEQTLENGEEVHQVIT